MQRLFSMFPSGLPGVALLALRASVVFALLSDLFTYPLPASGWLQAFGVLLAVFLGVGWLTPIASLVALAIHVALWLLLGSPVLATWATAVSDLIALCLLGPGAYSVDSYRFGRRVVVMPPP